jgi:transcriptional regulator with XRE-family HTH domain
MDGKTIKEVRLTLGYSQERLAREIGVSFCTVNRWERGRTVPSPMAEEKLRELKSRVENATYTNKRSAVRMNLSCPLRIEALSTAVKDCPAFTSLTKTISIGGLSFSTDRSVGPGDKLRIYIDFPGERVPVEVVSDVRWSNDLKGSRDIGVKFSDIRMEDLSRLKDAMLMSPAYC